MVVLALLAAAASSSAQTQPPQPLVREATATVRILAGARVTATETPAEALVRTIEPSDPDSEPGVSRLIEFP